MSQDIVKLQVARYWDRRAESYDHDFGHGLHNHEEHDLWSALLARNLGTKPLRVLDVGCGTGFLSLLLAEQGHTVTGLDMADHMRQAAARKAEAQGVSIDLLRGDAENPPFAPGSFDLVVSRHLLWTLPHPATAVANWRRLLAPGGAAVVIDGVWTPRNPAARLCHWLADGLRLVRGQKASEVWRREYADTASLPLYGGGEPDQVRALLAKAGCTGLWQDDLSEVLAFERRHAPLDFRLAHAADRNRRYLIGARR